MASVALSARRVPIVDAHRSYASTLAVSTKLYWELRQHSGAPTMRGFVLLSLLIAGAFSLADEPARPRKIVLIAGKKSHGPGAHDYERTMRLFKVMLDNSNVADRVHVEVHENGWPEDEKTLDDADTIVFNSDGRDGDKFTDVPFVRPERMKVIQKQIDRGCGMMTMHF